MSRLYHRYDLRSSLRSNLRSNGPAPYLEPGAEPDKIVRPGRHPICSPKPQPRPSYSRPSYYDPPPPYCSSPSRKPPPKPTRPDLIIFALACLAFFLVAYAINPPVTSSYSCIANCWDDAIANYSSFGAGTYHSVTPYTKGEASCFKEFTECYMDPEARAARAMSMCKREEAVMYEKVRACMADCWGRGWIAKEKSGQWK